MTYCIGIVYRLGIINQARNVGISVIRTFHLSGMAADRIGWWTRGPDNRGCTVLGTTGSGRTTLYQPKRTQSYCNNIKTAFEYNGLLVSE